MDHAVAAIHQGNSTIAAQKSADGRRVKTARLSLKLLRVEASTTCTRGNSILLANSLPIQKKMPHRLSPTA